MPAWNAVAGVHDFSHMRQLGSELSLGMKRAEVERGEAAALEQRDPQRFAQNELNRSRCSRGKPAGAAASGAPGMVR